MPRESKWLELELNDSFGRFFCLLLVLLFKKDENLPA